MTKQPKVITTVELVRACFPAKHKRPRQNQLAAFLLIAENESLVLEASTGTGKTHIGKTFLEFKRRTRNAKHRFYLVPNKALAQQVHELFPDTRIMLGRDEHTCLYYYKDGANVTARESPCAMLTDCPHRVNQETGQTHTAGVKPCPYLQQKYEAKQGIGDVVATFAFYLYSVFFSREWEGAEIAVTIDEADTLADSIRSVLSYEINERSIRHAAAVLSAVLPDEARDLGDFADTVSAIVSKYPSGKQTLLSEDDIRFLFRAVLAIDGRKLIRGMSQAIKASKFDSTSERELLMQVNDVALSLKRYAASLGFALDRPEANRKALSYVCAYWNDTHEQGERRSARKLVVRSWFVAALIKKMFEKTSYMAQSATIGDPVIFAQQTGLQAPVFVLENSLPVQNARIFVPTDTPHLATGGRRIKLVQQDKNRATNEIARGCVLLRKNNLRSLIVVVSEAERKSMMQACSEIGLKPLTYGAQPDGSNLKPREIVAKFRKGQGDVLVGTNAQFSKGIDLPKNTAQVVWVLRPAFPSPEDPLTEFQQKRMGQAVWSLWQNKVMVDALQVRGRNIRSASDKGVTIFVSQQFRSIVHKSLPQGLRQSYVGDKTLAQCLKETLAFLK